MLQKNIVTMLFFKSKGEVNNNGNLSTVVWSTTHLQIFNIIGAKIVEITR